MCKEAKCKEPIINVSSSSKSYCGTQFGCNLANRAGTFSFPSSASHKGLIAVALELDESRAMKAELGSKRSWPCSLPLLHMSAGSLPASRLNDHSPTRTISIQLPTEHCSPVTLESYYAENRAFTQSSTGTCGLAFQGEKKAVVSIFVHEADVTYGHWLLFINSLYLYPYVL